MFSWEIIRVAFSSLVSNKVRALLTMLGVVIGVGAVITMMAMGEGAKQAVQDHITGMIDCHLRVWASATNSFDSRYDKFSPDEYRTLAGNSTYHDVIVPDSPWGGSFQVKNGSHNARVQTMATTPGFFDIYNLDLADGRLFTETDGQARRRVAVLGATAARMIGAGPNIVGQRIRIDRFSFEVIGVLKPGAIKSKWQNPDPKIFIPMETAEYRLVGNINIMAISVRLRSESDMEAASEELEQLLRAARRLKPGEPNNFRVTPALDFGALKEQTAQTFGTLVLSIAAVSLLVGGIGVMNIMLVSVTERTREIGIRKALGARRSMILAQFVFEAIVLCVMGGVLGAGAGIGASSLMASESGWLVVITPMSVVLALACSIGIGLFFGVFPAVRASRLDPVEALRYE
jgi:putative ABC transport system permease protein